MTLSVVLPCYNEAENIEETIADVIGWFAKADVKGTVIAVNDGSQDRTDAVLDALQARLPNLVVVHHAVNQGYGAAIRTGCDTATTDAIAFMDSDGQFRAEEIGMLVPHLARYPFVAGVRMRRADPLHRKLNSWLYGRILVRVILGIVVRDINCGLKLFTRTTWLEVRPQHATGALFNAEVFLNLKEKNIPFTEVHIPHYPRKKGNPTGAKPGVILRMFRELFALRRDHAAHIEQWRAMRVTEDNA